MDLVARLKRARLRAAWRELEVDVCFAGEVRCWGEAALDRGEIDYGTMLLSAAEGMSGVVRTRARAIRLESEGLATESRDEGRASDQGGGRG